jgi:nitrate reductase molybdenum cofactor assembly chaperone NarJ/NarW
MSRRGGIIPKNIKQDNKFLLKLISVLLLYPDDELIDWMPSLENELDETVTSAEKNRILLFVAAIKHLPLLNLQEHYTRIFDINPKSSLNLTYHTIGDTDDRGRTLAQLDQIYRQAGYERTTGELPDYLPLVLEFLAECPHAEKIDLLWVQFDAVNNIAAILDDLNSPYRFLFEILMNLSDQLDIP